MPSALKYMVLYVWGGYNCIGRKWKQKKTYHKPQLIWLSTFLRCHSFCICRWSCSHMSSARQAERAAKKLANCRVSAALQEFPYWYKWQLFDVRYCTVLQKLRQSYHPTSKNTMRKPRRFALLCFEARMNKDCLLMKYSWVSVCFFSSLNNCILIWTQA